MLDNKSLVSSANYLTDLNSMYSKNISIEKNNMFIPNGIQHTIEATIGVFDRVTNTDDIINILEATNISSNTDLITQIQNIASAIDSIIADAIVTNTSGAIGSDVGLSISVQTDTTILKTLNIKVKYGSVVKYDIDSTSDNYIQILTSAGLIDINLVKNINDVAGEVIPNIDEILLVDDKAAQVSADTLSVTEMKNEVTAMRDTVVSKEELISPHYGNIDTVAGSIGNVNNVGDNINNVNSVAINIVPNLVEILDADTNAQIATSKAAEASESQLLAERWASENEDVVVDNDRYSARHYALKAEYYSQISDSSIDDSTPSGIHTYSSSKIENDLNKIGFDTTADVVVSAGQIAWNNTEGTIDIGLENGSVLQAGQENIRKVTNNSGALISDGTLVMFNGTNGASGRINVKPFTAGFDEAIKLYGVATQAIVDGADGIITIEGKVRGIDTTGASVGEVWVDNDILYAKPNDNGRMTKIAPADNELKIVVASVIKAHHENGTLEIRFMPFNENAYYTKVQNDILLDNKVPLNDGFTLDLGEL